MSTIYGIDISKGSPHSGDPPEYSLCILNKETGELKEFSGLRLYKILRMASNDFPEALAVDNIFELAADKNKLIQVMQSFPDDMKLIQVTGGSDNTLKLSLPELAHKHGLSMRPEISADEARCCALLADMGVGTLVSLFENKTRIKVSRSRSPGKGGWSQNRYARKIHGSVREKAREIESRLEEYARNSGNNFESNVSEGFGGYVRAEFTVYAPKSEVPVHSGVFGDCRVFVSNVARDKIQFIPLEKKSRDLTIVGIDPGTTVGIAVFSLRGDLLFKGSFRGLSPTDTIRKISEYGKPLIIASDVCPVPSSVEKIRRAFQAVSKSPDHEIPASEKIKLARPYNYANDHERDALTAGILTYKSLKPLFSRIENKTPAGIKPDDVKERVVRGESVECAISSLSSSPAHIRSGPSFENLVGSVSQSRRFEDVERLLTEIKKIHEELRSSYERISYQASLISEKNELIARSQKEIQILEKRIEKIQTKAYSQTRQNKEIQIRDDEIRLLKKQMKNKNKEINNLRRQRNKMRAIRKRELRGEGHPVKVIAAFTRESISDILTKYGLSENDIVYLSDPSGGGAETAEFLAETNVRAIIASPVLSHKAADVFFQKNIAVLDPKNLDLETEEDIGVASPDLLEKEMKKAQEILKIQKRKKDEEKLQHMLDEYRSERRRGLL